jgi:hypothetical protein
VIADGYYAVLDPYWPFVSYDEDRAQHLRDGAPALPEGPRGLRPPGPRPRRRLRRAQHR